MANWTPSERLPRQLADAFAGLYDWFLLEEWAFEADDQLWEEAVLGDPRVKALINAVTSSDEDTPVAVQNELDLALASGDDMALAQAAYRCLHAIDRGFAKKHPTGGGSPSRLRERYLETARYNTDEVAGYVLPKWTRRYSGTSFAEHFLWLVRANVDRKKICVLGRGGRARRSRKVENPTVVVVPFLYTFFADAVGPSDAEFCHVPVGQRHCFGVRHKSAGASHLRTRIANAVEAIRDSGAQIAIFPELALDERLLGLLRDQLGATHRSGGMLEWVIAGAAIPPQGFSRWPVTNAAYVLTSAGNIVASSQSNGTEIAWIQAKRHRYKLNRKAQKNYDVVSCFPDHRDRVEAISLGRKHIVFEDRTGRYAILICEDLTQEEQTLEHLRKMLCRLVFVIVMDGPIEDGRWATEDGKKFATQTGGFVVVANSLLLPNLPNIRKYRECEKGIPDPYPDADQNVGLVVEPQREEEAPPDLVWMKARTTALPKEARTLRSTRAEVPFR